MKRDETIKSIIQPLWSVHEGPRPLFATALHSGHEVRNEVEKLLALDEITRLREEDPYTDYLATVSPTRIIPFYSRFEVDLNRPREEAVYLTPEDAWGLQVWEHTPGQEIVQRSLAEYDAFYAELKTLLTRLEKKYGLFIIFDLHSYNYRRHGPTAEPENPQENPDVNIGTGTLDREYWGPVVDRFIRDLRQYDFLGRHLDVRENVKFVGRQLAAWVHQQFPKTGCVLSIEFKKFFMDEWSGAVDTAQIKALYDALRSTIPGLTEELLKLKTAMAGQ